MFARVRLEALLRSAAARACLSKSSGMMAAEDCIRDPWDTVLRALEPLAVEGRGLRLQRQAWGVPG